MSVAAFWEIQDFVGLFLLVDDTIGLKSGPRPGGTLWANGDEELVRFFRVDKHCDRVLLLDVSEKALHMFEVDGDCNGAGASKSFEVLTGEINIVQNRVSCVGLSHSKPIFVDSDVASLEGTAQSIDHDLEDIAFGSFSVENFVLG